MTEGRKIGTIHGMHRDNYNVTFEWRIPDFCSIPETCGNYYWSPEIEFSGTNYYLGIFPNGEKRDRKWIGFYVCRNVWNADKRVHYSLGINKVYGLGTIKLGQINEFEQSSGLIEFLPSSNLNFQLMPSDELTLICKLWIPEISSVEEDRLVATGSETASGTIEAEFTFLGLTDKWFGGKCRNSLNVQERKLALYKKRTEDVSVIGSKEERAVQKLTGKTLVSRETQTEDVKDSGGTEEDLDLKAVFDLRKHFKEAFLSGDDKDVLIKVQGREFRAHETVLRARSPVFAAMFRNKMKENTGGCVEIDDCDPQAFGEFLHYVYTAEVQNLSLTNAMTLYYAGDKYDFSVLKEICVKFLMTSLSTSVICDVIAFAERHGEEELLGYAISYFSQHLEEIMITAEWQRFLASNPVQGNELCLKAVKNLKVVFKKPE